MALATRAVTQVTPPSDAFSRALNGRVIAIFPRLSSLADRITIEDAMLDETNFVAHALRPYGVDAEVEVVDVEPGEAEISHAVEAARGAAAVILFLYDAHLYPSNRALLDALQKAGSLLGVILMRDPWDAEYLARGTVAVTAYGWRRCQLDAALARLLAPARPRA